MLTRLTRQSWICRNISHKRPDGLLTAAAIHTSRTSLARPVDFARGTDKHDDRLLRELFDSRTVWEHFNELQPDSKSVGLFRNILLTQPGGFEKYALTTLDKCRAIVDKVLGYNSAEQYRSLASDLDRLSDLLCRVIDLSEFVRATHPNVAMQTSATQAYTIMFDYMNVLNTTPGLNQQLKIALANPEVVASWSEEEHTVAKILSKDFDQSAIDLPEKERRQFVELSNDISQAGSTFLDSMVPAKAHLEITSSRLNGMDPLVVRQFTAWGRVKLPTHGRPANIALRTVDDADVRRDIYMANRTSSADNIQRLEHIMRKRTDIARLSGYDSFAHMTLSDKLAKSPESVSTFLAALSRENAPLAQSQLSELLDLKRGDANKRNFADQINAWDREYYATRLTSSLRYHSRSDHLSAYFSLGTVMQGLSRLFSRLYGIRFVPRETLKGETWHKDVRRLDVIDNVEGHVAVIYCDLFQRAGKSPNPAHFTIRCSRRISDGELKAAAEDAMYADEADGANDGFATYGDADGAVFQAPTIALICDFATAQSGPALLTFSEVQTLFHEMGHALHSICGRTTHQNVSGTRCATDFAELPSVLMEHFASSPEVLALYARHWETDAPLDPARVQERIELDRRTHGSEVEGQILMSMLDQAYHSSLAANPSFDSTRIYHEIWNAHSIVPEPAGTSWQGFFGHLVGYGAVYYAYLFDRVIAGKIWRDVFQKHSAGAIDARAGETFRQEMLQWGGSRDGWKCIAGVLGDRDGVLAEGKQGAMEMVGQWGLKS